LSTQCHEHSVLTIWNAYYVCVCATTSHRNAEGLTKKERELCAITSHTHCMKRKLVAYTRNGFVSGSLINACEINARNTREQARAEQMKNNALWDTCVLAIGSHIYVCETIAH
jgi:hypothetical protein